MRSVPTEIWSEQVKAYHLDAPTGDTPAPTQAPVAFGCYQCAAKPALPTDPLPALNTVYFVNGTSLCIQHAGAIAREESNTKETK